MLADLVIWPEVRGTSGLDQGSREPSTPDNIAQQCDFEESEGGGLAGFPVLVNGLPMILVCPCLRYSDLLPCLQNQSVGLWYLSDDVERHLTN